MALGIEFRVPLSPKLVLGFGKRRRWLRPTIRRLDADHRCRRVLLTSLRERGRIFRRLAGPHDLGAFVLHAGFGTLGLPPAGGHLVVDESPRRSTRRWKPSAVTKRSSRLPKGTCWIGCGPLRMQQGQAAGYFAGELLASPRTLGTRDLMHFLFGMKPGDEPANRTCARWCRSSFISIWATCFLYL